MKLYNTLTRSLEPFSPLAPPAVTMYVCGPTVYDDPHIGHVRSAYIFDVLRRYLTHQGFAVRFIRNVTDVDDKIIEKARQELVHSPQSPPQRMADPPRSVAGTVHSDLKAKCREVAARYLTSYHTSMDRLGIERPTIEPLATEHVVPEMTDCIAKLLLQGAAYEAKGDVYFSVRKFPGYGKLSNRMLDELQAGARVEPGEHKQDPLDFALWKAAKPDEPSWESPWGKGRPGWHIECSTMSTKYLGEEFDIHGGGVDLVFPHHENEMAQARSTGKPFARYWVHNGLLTVKGEKMSKSLGNYFTVEQVLAQHPHPDYLKIFFLKTHYRSPIDYSPEKMGEAKKNWEEFSWFLQHYDHLKVRGSPGQQRETLGRDLQAKFEEAMDDDLNTPKAMAVLFEAVRLGREGLEQRTLEGSGVAAFAYQLLLDCGMTLGVFQQGMSEERPETLERIRALMTERDAARTAKDFTKADAIRRRLQEEGYHVTDTPHGTLWRRLEPQRQ